MQGGAAPHIVKNSWDWLTAIINQRVPENKTVWAPYSPELNPLRLFLWGQLKDLVYRDSQTTNWTPSNELMRIKISVGESPKTK